MAMTGTKDSAPQKCGAPVVDYATGTMGAFAIATALFQRERTGSGQHIDLSMLDVALVLSGSHIAAHGWNGAHPEPHGNSFPFATLGCYQAKDVPLMISASNLPQQRRLWTALGRPEMIKQNNNQRLDAYAVEAAPWSRLSRRARRTSGRHSSRRTAFLLAASAGWRRRWPIRTSLPGLWFIGTVPHRALTAR